MKAHPAFKHIDWGAISQPGFSGAMPLIDELTQDEELRNKPRHHTTKVPAPTVDPPQALKQLKFPQAQPPPKRHNNTEYAAKKTKKQVRFEAVVVANADAEGGVDLGGARDVGLAVGRVAGDAHLKSRAQSQQGIRRTAG